MPQPGSRLTDGALNTVFFDVHVERVQMNLAIGASHSFGEGDAFCSCVHDELLEAIDDFDAKQDAAVFGGLDCFTHALDRPVVEYPLVLARQQLARPGAIIDASHYG